MSPVLALAIAGILTLLQAFFVAAEFAFVAVRRSALEEAAAAGSRRARVALAVHRRMSFTLSGAQFGITLTSLLVGFLAERSLAALLIPLFDSFGLPAVTAETVAFAVAFLVFTILQMVVGELAPKNIAVARPQRVALGLAVAVRGYNTLFGPVIRVFDGSANWLSRRIGVEPHEELLGGHSLDEIRRIIEASSEGGVIPYEQAELLRGAVQLFGGRRVAEIMVPRPDVTWLDRDAPLSALRDAARLTGHSRFPVRGTSEDDVVGSVHIKDVLRVDGDGAQTLGDIATTALVVPESFELRRLLGELRRTHRTFAVVVDEYGDTAGIVTLEDVLEELVGEIEDEFDPATPEPRRLGSGRYVVPASVRADRLARLLGVEIPPGEFETAAGFVIDRLGRIPAEGDEVQHDGWTITVSRMDGVRIVELTVRRTEPGSAPDHDDVGGRP